MRLFLLVIVLAFVPPPAEGQFPRSGSPPADSVVAALRSRIPDLLDQHNVPGLSIAFVRGDSTHWSAGFGTTRASTGEPVTAHTVFEAASLSKPVFALLVLRLVEERRFDLVTPLHRYAPVPGGADPRLRDVTARHVLSHTSGLPNWMKGDTLRLKYAPSHRWQYSGEGYVYLQQAVEHHVGQSLNTLADRLVFGPLRTRRSSYRWRPSYDSLAATGHDAYGRPQDKRRPGAETVRQYGAAATLHTTAQDYARVLRALVGGAESITKPHASLLSDSLRQGMLTSEARVDSTLGLSWGLGWGLEAVDHERWFFHWGANPHFRSFAMGNRSSTEAFVAFTNGTQGLELMDDVATIVTGRDHPLFSFYMLHPSD